MTVSNDHRQRKIPIPNSNRHHSGIINEEADFHYAECLTPKCGYLSTPHQTQVGAYAAYWAHRNQPRRR